MHRSIIYVNPVTPDAIGFTTGAGLPGDIRIDFKTIAGMPYPALDTLYPQLVLRPFTSTGSFGYDIVVDDILGASGLATIPGSVMNDRFNIEVYSRNSDGQPQDLLANGRIDLTGYGYMSSGPLSPATYSVGPMGPAGPVGPTGAQGQPGIRGSQWFTGAGPPSISGSVVLVEGDMWLDESTGDVWRYSSGLWSLFTGTGTP